jgi:hypothetical protein
MIWIGTHAVGETKTGGVELRVHTSFVQSWVPVEDNIQWWRTAMFGVHIDQEALTTLGNVIREELFGSYGFVCVRFK